ncbi:hypothetical protein BJ969_003121 [Saccharopolyspora gloriosae]|uniref:Tetratricopeptide repeat protein n=1 Tax=Saccharopolyspora gloriosae TaxID=455344 RepID=A0A840NIL9_9PSEU|nr:hypothetical protein [Saccharopolyspora gloriosae]MBB5070033.1 hypothetical protein [Saccharopolyspora gloriosae]
MPDSTSWQAELAHAGEHAAITAHQPDVLAELLEHSARAWHSANPVTAESQWIRALTIRLCLPSDDALLATVDALTQLYAQHHRWSLVLDLNLWLLAYCDDHGHLAGAVHAHLALVHAGRSLPAREHLGP